MHKYFPLLLVGGIIGVITLLLCTAYALVKDKKESMGFERQMKDGEIVRRLLKYANPYRWQFVLVGFLVLFSILYDLVSPLIVGEIEEMLTKDFPLRRLFLAVAAYALILIFSMAMLATASVLYQSGAIGFDGLLISLIALMSSFGPVVALANLGSTLQQTFAAGNRVLDVLDEEPIVAENTTGETVEFEGATCRNVSFRYDEQPILKNINLDFAKNQIIGITGRSGSGKSTLLKLLMRFWDTTEGQVEISGTDVRNIRTSCLRQMQSYVTQETYLFHDSIEANVKIARPDATREQVVEACKKASVHDFIMCLPKGYDTPVGELGDTLSGGERQRLGIARTFLHDAPLILLDEPTSNLDSLNEAVILQSLHQQRENKTVVLVSHRASTMQIADVTHSVEHGRLS